MEPASQRLGHFLTTVERQPGRGWLKAVKTLNLCLGAGLGVSLAACTASHSEHMTLLEKHGIGQRDCHASAWFIKARPADADTVQFGTQDDARECSASQSLVEELQDQHGLWRRYRCKVRGKDVEVSYSTSDSDPYGFGACNYAYSGDEPFIVDKRYTDFAWRREAE